MKIRKVQICIIVKDLEAAMEKYQRLFGVGPFSVYTVDTSQMRGVTYRGQPANYLERVGIANFSGVLLELLEFQGGDSIYKEFVDKHGEGVQHIGLVVEDYKVAFQQMLDQGFHHSQGGPIEGLNRDGSFDFFDTEKQLGTTFELLDFPEQLAASTNLEV